MNKDWKRKQFIFSSSKLSTGECFANCDVQAQPALWLVAADCVVTASWVFVPNFSSISRSSCSQFAFWLLLSRRPILYQQFWWNRQMCTLITASAKFEFTASLGALKFRKPYKENQFSASYSETIGPILMITLTSTRIGCRWKCWKNQSSSISERKRASSYHYVLRPVGHQKLLQMQKSQRETWGQCQKCFRNKYIEPFNLLLLFVYCHF